MLRLYEGDCREKLRSLIAQGVRVHSVVTDPPYLLESIVKRFGKPGSAPAKEGSDGRFARASAGFMGKKWDGAEEDGTRIPQDPEFWRLIHDILLPGGYVLAFSSPRTGHRQACAMEDAGLLMHPMIGWVYGQGMPKAHSVSRMVNKTLTTKNPTTDFVAEAEHPENTPAAADPYEGWYHGAQSLKPALEPIYMAQRPYSTKTAYANVLEHGTGAVNIDACRIHAPDAQGFAYKTSRFNPGATVDKTGQWNSDEVYEGKTKPGRWPANLIHDGSPEVVAMFPDDAGARAPVHRRNADKFRGVYGAFKGNVDEAGSTFQGDEGSAARFFNAFPLEGGVWEVHADQVIFYHPKATSRDRVYHCDGCDRRTLGKPACGCVDAKVSNHPTVKPVDLMRHLVRLVTPAGGTVLDPFAGSGTTGAAAAAEGFDSILIERDPDYVADIRHRLGLPANDRLPPGIEDLLSGDSGIEKLLA